MYRVAMLTDKGPVLLCRGCKTVSGYQQPRFVRDPSDRRVNTFGTKWGALRAQAKLIGSGYKEIVVFDAATGREIDESLEARNCTAI